MLINSLNHLDFMENSQRFRDYINALEQERGKIQVFRRELPLCLELVTQAIAACKQQLSGTESNCNLNVQSSCSEQTSSELPILEEFIPLKRVLSNDSYDGEEESPKPKNDMNSKKSDWLRSVQLWNQSPDPPSKLGVKRDGSVGAFHPFKKDKSCGTAPTASAQVLPPASAGGDVGKDGGGNKKEEKERQSQRKARRTWSPELHRRFLQALEQFGGPDVATPKLIREFMKVDGLTNDEVKSHLQKYRLHIRKPNPSCQSTTINSPQTPQYVVVGGMWLSPEYAKMATTTASEEASGGATSIGVYTPIASLSLPFRETSASPKERHHTRALDFNDEDRLGESLVQSHSPATSSSTGTTSTVSPEY
ncbi:transcription factor HHO3-like [Henckelia pumila]|uniref:transcription factor HHO3-like n=1 Tax=Henckelia pumila TaxID=405737 RepID=UPI003C6DF32A